MSLYKAVTCFLNGVMKVFFLFKAYGSENIPSEGAFLLCSNHRALRDPIFLAASCKRQLTFMAKEELFKVPVVSWFIKKCGAFPIRRGKSDAGAVMATIKILRHGGATLIFPEGTRMKNGDKKQINSGIIRLAIQSNAMIVPALCKKRSVHYGKPIAYEKYIDYVKDAEKMQSLADELMETIYTLDK